MCACITAIFINTNNSIITIEWMKISFRIKYLWVKNYKSTGCNSHSYFICSWHNTHPQLTYNIFFSFSCLCVISMWVCESVFGLSHPQSVPHFIIFYSITLMMLILFDFIYLFINDVHPSKCPSINIIHLFFLSFLQFIHLVPRTELIGDPDRYVKAGSIVTFRCVVRGALEPPTYIIWYHGSQQIYVENLRGWKVQFERDVEGDTHSSVS